jgi:hypothetical protein
MHAQIVVEYTFRGVPRMVQDCKNVWVDVRANQTAVYNGGERAGYDDVPENMVTYKVTDGAKVWSGECHFDVLPYAVHTHLLGPSRA